MHKYVELSFKRHGFRVCEALQIRAHPYDNAAVPFFFLFYGGAVL